MRRTRSSYGTSIPAGAGIIGAQFLAGGGSYLGVGVAEVTPERAKALKLKEERGAEITSVEADSPAAKAGLKAHDVVLEYNGQRVEGIEQFTRMVRETPAERQVRLTISRDGATQALTATIGQRKGYGTVYRAERGRRTPAGKIVNFAGHDLEKLQIADAGHSTTEHVVAERNARSGSRVVERTSSPSSLASRKAFWCAPWSRIRRPPRPG